ncbi:MAG: hypothetical protein H0T62_12460 [Parachlamydiaceae bacterium]|nr:hypothetical protein [Parachlamydiaceae bacterium]
MAHTSIISFKLNMALELDVMELKNVKLSRHVNAELNQREAYLGIFYPISIFLEIGMIEDR